MKKLEAVEGVKNANSIDEFVSALHVVESFRNPYAKGSTLDEKFDSSAVLGILNSIDSNYHTFSIPKKSGARRIIHAPSKRLKLIQYIISYALTELFDFHESAHGFMVKRGIQTNAIVHVGSEFVLNVDIKDFFPSVTINRIEKNLEGIGFTSLSARLIGLLCTKNNKLPQGSPASPVITNIVSKQLDDRLERFAIARGCQYSRYVDDITFSADYHLFNSSFEKKLTKIIETEGFRLNITKTRILSKSDRQEVTGIVINEKLNVNRKFIRKVRAMIHTLSKEGALDDQNELKSLVTKTLGCLSFISQVRGKDDPLYNRLNNQLTNLLRDYEC